jgi:hypothetical protein
MNEMLFQFIWQYSLYNPTGLLTTEGEAVTIIHPGKRNTNSGPDFEEARIKIGNTVLVGNVELHIKSGDWNRHGHESDKAYQNIILHVVYIDDERGNIKFPKLVLGRNVPAYVIDQYTNLIQTTQPIACQRQLTKVSTIVKEGWLNRLLAERWEEKLLEWKELLKDSKGDWSTLFYWRLAANFGFKVNAVPFLMLARSLPLNILSRHKDNLFQLEALLFGQAGLLEEGNEIEYAQSLKKEYDYLQLKYKLQPIAAHLWKFMRMRPANFPTIRIAQFASLVHHSVHLFSSIVENNSAKEIHKLFDVSASEYWNDHYRFAESFENGGVKKLGKDSINNIIINTVAPVQFLYAHHNGTNDHQEKALHLLTSIPAESNKFIELWNNNGWTAETAFHSQALLQLFNKYCSRKRCLECAVGLNIIKNKK